MPNFLCHNLLREDRIQNNIEAKQATINEANYNKECH